MHEYWATAKVAVAQYSGPKVKYWTILIFLA